MDSITASDREVIQKALEEDLGREGDLTSQALSDPSCKVKALIIAKERGVLAGLPFAKEVFDQLDKTVEFEALLKDGSPLEKFAPVAQINGPARAVLSGERLALNLLMRLSGIATATKKFVDPASSQNIRILDTRKTSPTLRDMEKYAVRMGGGENHRQGLFDQVLIKENHIKVAGSVKRSLELVKEKVPSDVKIEIEVETLDELREVMAFHPHIVLLDNMAPEQIREALEILKDSPEIEVEVSGGVNLENIDQFLIPGVHRIAIGALTHSAPSLDFSLQVQEVYP